MAEQQRRFDDWRIDFNTDGTLRYLTKTELDALEAKEATLLKKEWVAPDFSEAFDNLELVFMKKGGTPATDARIHRHFAQNLDDEHFGKDAGMQAYLNSRGRIVAMTKAASYLLWRSKDRPPAFETIRNYLLEHMDFMISDSTGIPPSFAAAAGFQQQAYGRFAESFLPANPKHNADFVKLWKKSKPLKFRYGYVDKNLSSHMLVTFKAPPDEKKTP